MIRVRSLTKSFGDRVVLRSIDLVVPDAKIVVILGPSGAGKTILLRIMTGLLAPDAGTVDYDGTPLGFGLFADNRRVLAQVGFVFQGGALFDSLSVAANVALPLQETTDLMADAVSSRVSTALDRVGMLEHAQLMPRELSGGMKRLTALARAFVGDPRYLFYDEPTTGLDPLMRQRIQLLMRSLRDRDGKAGVVVTHDLESAQAVADMVYMLRGGRLMPLDGARKEDYEATCT